MGNVQSVRTKQKGLRLMAMGNKEYKAENYPEAIQLNSRALAFLPSHKYAVARADCLDHLVKLYWRIGDLDKALECSKETLTIKEKTMPASNAMAKTLSDIACIFYERGEYTKALHLHQGSLAIREKVVPDSLGVAVSCTNLALVLSKLGRRQEALEQHERARKIKEELAPNSVSLARTYISLSNNASNFEQAMEMLDKAKVITKSIQPAPTSLIASLDVNRGNLLLAAGHNEKAIRYYEKAIRREEKVAPDSLIMATMLHQLALACEEEGLQPEARAARGKSIDIRHRKAPTYLEQAVLKKD